MLLEAVCCHSRKSGCHRSALALAAMGWLLNAMSFAAAGIREIVESFHAAMGPLFLPTEGDLRHACRCRHAC